MKNITLALVLVCSVGFGQNLDFEKTGFEIKPISMKKEKTVMAYHVAQKDVPSRFNLVSVEKDNSIQFNPIDREYVAYVPNPSKHQLRVEPLKGMDAFTFGNDGSIRGVKNIAYEPSTGGNLSDAYCRALYASRSGN